jgi:hypothetical protein
MIPTHCWASQQWDTLMKTRATAAEMAAESVLPNKSNFETKEPVNQEVRMVSGLTTMPASYGLGRGTSIALAW